ncbi:9281_t:CDS:1 [Ambispora gerdemannii]|uniref:9281_t:CDS:1 n=1 Tax=Ambispora gerdemannii TaxID=144530 RepID=A0A9N9BIQ6_9GLOM|nr:9281_t:CDS:1 [Ambispora gerdemannii]
MASTLAALCLHEIFKNFSTLEAGHESTFYNSSKHYNYEDEIYRNRRQLFYCALVNRHWCYNAIPILWKRPFPLSSGGSFVATLLRCLGGNEDYEDNESRPLFRYNLFIKQFSLESILGAFVQWTKLKWHENQQRNSGKDSDDAISVKIPTIPDIWKTLCHDLINSSTTILFELDYEYDKVGLLHRYEFPDSDWNIFQLPNAKTSLGQLRYLKISTTGDIQLLESAAKICPNLSSLEINSYSSTWLSSIFKEYSQYRQLLSYFGMFKNLKSLKLDCGQYTSTIYGNEFLTELGKKLPKTLETLSIDGDLNFSVDSLDKFLHGAREIHFKLLGFPHSECFSDEHLEIILEAVKNPQLDIRVQKLDLSEARFLTRNNVEYLKLNGIETKVDSLWDEVEWEQQIRYNGNWDELYVDIFSNDEFWNDPFISIF